MRRAASVDDLFAPMWSLNVHANATDFRYSCSTEVTRPCSDLGTNTPNVRSLTDDTSCSTRAAPATQNASPTARAVRIASGSGQPLAPPNDAERARPFPCFWGYSSVPTTMTVDERRCRKETRSRAYGERSDLTGNEKVLEIAVDARRGRISRSSSEIDGVDVKPLLFSLESDSCTALHVFSTAKSAGGGVSTAKSNWVGGTEAFVLPLSQSTSDDDQVNGSIDDRKAKRMLSNRESARRSRLRKQQHLDELRSQVAQLRAQNTDMHAKFSIASHRFSQLNGENHVLRTHAEDLTQKLRHLYHTLSSQHPSGLHALGIPTGHLDPDPIGSFFIILFVPLLPAIYTGLATVEMMYLKV